MTTQKRNKMNSRLLVLPVMLLLSCGGGEKEPVDENSDPQAVQPPLTCIELLISCEACTNATDQILCNLQVATNDEEGCEAASDYFYESCISGPCLDVAEVCAQCDERVDSSSCLETIGINDAAFCEYWLPVIERQCNPDDSGGG